MIYEGISDDISPNENFEYGYPHSNALLQFHLKLECCKPHNTACHPTKCDVIYDIKLFPTVYHRIYCCKFLTLSNQKSHYKSKCIRIPNQALYQLAPQKCVSMTRMCCLTTIKLTHFLPFTKS